MVPKSLGGSPYLLDTQRVTAKLSFWGEQLMTYLEVAFHYLSHPGEKELRALDSVREVYGIQRISFEEKGRVVRVLFDASRLNEDNVARLLLQAGLEITDKLQLA
jgi:hypothetical protein